MANDQNSEILLKLTAIDNLTPVMLKSLQAMEANSAKMAAALDKVSDSTHKTQENTAGLHGGLVSLEAGLDLAERGLELVHHAFEAVGEQIHKAIEISLEAEQAQTRLQGALVSTGKYTSALNDELSEYAEHLQKTTGVSAESVKQIIGTGIQMGLTTEKAKALVSASQKLAATTGTDVNSAFRMLQGSLAGHARALAMNVAGVSDLSASQLKAGGAIDLVNQQLTAQFQIYQGSFAAGVSRAHAGIEGLYKTFGDLIVQNPAVKEALNQFAIVLGDINEFADKNHMSMKAWVSDGVLLLIDSLEGVNVTFDAIERGGVIAFKSVEVALQTLALGIVTVIDGPIAAFYKALSYLPGEQGQQFQAKVDEISAHMAGMAGNVNKSAQAIEEAMAGPTKTSQALTDNILKIREAVQTAITAERQHKSALEETNEAMSKQNAEASKLQQTYAGFAYGNTAMREALERDVSDRDKALKDFEMYLDAHKRLAVSQAMEEQMAVHAIASKALTTPGGTDTSAAAQVEIDSEVKRQASLQVLRQKGILSEAQYQIALLASQQRAQQAQFNSAMAFEKAQADLLGNSPAGQQKKLMLAQQQFQLRLQQKKQQAQQEGLTQKQIDQMVQQENQNNLAQMKLMKQKFIEDDMRQNEILGNNWQVSLDRIALAQEKWGVVMGTLRGVQQTEEFKGTMTALNNLASLRSSKAKGAFEVGKAAAIAQTGIQTSMAAMEAYAAMAAIPFVGPALGIAAAAAAIAAGMVQIQNISSQQFNPGGQAHGGMDEIPSSLNNKTFLLAGGERVVQPEANKDLTAFLDRQKSSGANSNVYNINVTYKGTGGSDDADKLAEVIAKKLRAMSDKGTPIINAKGIVNT